MESARRTVSARVADGPSAAPATPPPYANDRTAALLTEQAARRAAEEARSERAEPPAPFLRVLPLGTGMVVTGMVLALIALRLRRS
ncbi:hypothetical protein [Streptomyces pactum]|uniref:hypothetical protein n=1 Tax=Streptomyces pactum TaxID=68249 RepID=UPI0036FDE887